MLIAKRTVFLSIIFMLGGFLILFFEIENPFHMFFYNVISPNLTSNLWWMGTLYGAYLVFMIIEYYYLSGTEPFHFQDHGIFRLSGGNCRAQQSWSDLRHAPWSPFLVWSLPTHLFYRGHFLFTV